MRKWNNVLARVIIVLFLLHALMGSLMLLGISRISLKPLSWFLLSTVLLHGILGIISTIPAFKTVKKTGQWFFKENAASIASMVLTTESLVTDAPEKKCDCGHSDNGMGAGMDGMY